MRVIVDFNEENKLTKKISGRNEKLDKYLLEKEIVFYSFPSIDGFGYDRFLISDVDNEQFEQIFSFITTELKASPKCIHLPYQTLCVDGEGNIEAIEELHISDINRFVQTKYNKLIELPQILVLDQNKYVRTRWYGNIIAVKCVCCHEQAEYINSGLSLCKVHFLESLQKQKESNKKSEEAFKKDYEKMEKQLADITKSLEEIKSSPNPREKFKDIYR